jgi:hypothetical protein
VSLTRQAFCFMGEAICCEGGGWGASSESRFALAMRLFASALKSASLSSEAFRVSDEAPSFEVRSKKPHQ